MKRWMTLGLSSLFVVAFALSMALTMAGPAKATDSGVTCCIMGRCPNVPFGASPYERLVWSGGCLHYGTSCDYYCGYESAPIEPPSY